MTSPSRIPVDEIREAARLAVEAESLRAVARAVGLSPMGLKNFLEGRTPYSATRRKLNTWYVTHGDGRPVFDDSVARASIAVLLEGISEPQRDDAARKLLVALQAIYDEKKAPPPAWLAQLARK
jgi:hypothetical protein